MSYTLGKFAAGVYDGRVITATELRSNGAEGQRRKCLAEIHRHLTILDDLRFPALAGKCRAVHVCVLGDRVNDGHHVDSTRPSVLLTGSANLFCATAKCLNGLFDNIARE